MIQAKDLRIGNWVDTIDGQLQVIDVMCDSVNTKLHNGLLFDDTDDIPLSEDVLVRCGFTTDRWGWVIVINDFRLRLDIHYSYKLLNENPISIKYLHQLQNLFYAVAGTELTYQTKS